MLSLFDTLTRSATQAVPAQASVVKMFTCWPDGNRYPHIGDLRGFLMADCIRRAVEMSGVAVEQSTGIEDFESEGPPGMPALPGGADPDLDGPSADVSQSFHDRLLEDRHKLNIAPSEHAPKATESIEVITDVARRLLDQDFAYEVDGNLFFSMSKAEEYGLMSGRADQEEVSAAIPMEGEVFKLDPRDFPIWEAAQPDAMQKWQSPWGEGVPGSHTTCTALTLSSLGEQIDIHTGEIHDVYPHHECKKALFDGATGKRAVSLWTHCQPLLVDGAQMSQRAGNSWTLVDLEARGIEPLAFRYLCLTAKFGSPLSFSLSSLRAGQRALSRLRQRIWEWESLPSLGNSDEAAMEEWEGRFQELVNSNLNMPGALALTWSLVASDLPGQLKLDLVRRYDRVLGLGLANVSEGFGVPENIEAAAQRRVRVREEALHAVPQEGVGEAQIARLKQAKFQEADGIRQELLDAGYVVEDARGATRVRPRARWEAHEDAVGTISSAADVRSNLNVPDTVDFTIGLVFRNYIEDVGRCVQSALRWAGERSVELVAVDNASTDETGLWLEAISKKDNRIQVTHVDHPLGAAASRNLVLKLSRGKTVVLLEPSVEVRGEYLEELDSLLNDDNVAVAGPFGLRSGDLKEFDEAGRAGGDVVALQSGCIALRRAIIREVGMMRESFRVPDSLDLDYSLRFKDKGYRVVAEPSLPIRRHEQRTWSELAEEEWKRLAEKNRRRFAAKWGQRTDLLETALAEVE